MLNSVRSDCLIRGGTDRQAGFALVEVLAALAILALSLSVLFAVLSDGVRRTSHAEKLAEATLQAQSLLARVGSEIALKPGVTTGQLSDGSRWQLSVEPHGDAGERRAWPVGAYKVSAEIAWNDGQERSLTLATLRLGAKESAR